MVFHSLKEVQTELSSKSITLKNVVSQYLQNIEARKNLNAFLEVWGDEALVQFLEIAFIAEWQTGGRLLDCFKGEAGRRLAPGVEMSGQRRRFLGPRRALLEQNAAADRKSGPSGRDGRQQFTSGGHRLFSS